MPMIEKPAESTPAADPISELQAFNAQTDWPSEEARLRHEELDASMLPLPMINESTDALYGESLSVFPDLPAIQYVY